MPCSLQTSATKIWQNGSVVPSQPESGGARAHVALHTTSLGTRGEKQEVVVATHTMLDAPLRQCCVRYSRKERNRCATDGSGQGFRRSRHHFLTQRSCKHTRHLSSMARLMAALSVCSSSPTRRFSITTGMKPAVRMAYIGQ